MNALLESLNDAQKEAVTHTDGPLLVLAGAGTGKTRVITRRAAYLAETVTQPWNVVAITFTNKAAGEMRERITSLGVATHMTIATFHSLCARLLRTYADAAGVSPRFSIFDDGDQRSAIKEAVVACDLALDNWQPARIQREISNAKNAMQSPAEYAATVQNGFWDLRQIAKIYEAYEAELARQEALDFDDLLVRVARLLQDNADVRAELQRRFTHVLIDEYQDTNRAQYLIARLLAEAHENICATGDPDQSIYAWRGADLRNILDFERDYPGAKVVRLEQNYRSTKRILAAASSLIAANQHRKTKTLWTENAEGPQVTIVPCADAEEEAQRVTERIESLADAGRPLRDIAVFYRMNSMTRVVEDALRKTRVPYQIARGTEFYNRKEIKDTLAYLRVLANPADEVSLLRIINVPARGIGKVTVDRLVAEARRSGRPLLDAVMSPAAGGLVGKSAAGKIARFAELIARLTALVADHPVRDIVEATLLQSGLQASLDESPDSDPLENVNELVTAAAEFDERGEEGGLVTWLHQISLVSDQDAFDEQRGAVTLMTLHAAKGLEFPVVFILGLEDGTLPHARYRESPGDIEEERRLCFVGMTRAKEQLTMSYAAFRMSRGISLRSAPSPFIREIGRDNVVVEQPAGADASDDVPPPSDFDFHDGQLVRHAKFGVGQVLWIDPRGRQTRAAVRFAGGERTLILEYANLQVVDEYE